MSKKFISILLSTLLLLSGCARHSLSDTETNLTDTEQNPACVHGASSLYYTSVSDAGVFYIENIVDGKLLCYYDYDAKSRFVLCSAPECSHKDENCAAFFPSTTLIEGFAYYDHALYLLQRELKDAAYQLMQMSVNCENRTVLSTLAAEGDWNSMSIQDVYYCGGYAWIHATYQQFDAVTRETTGAQKLLAVSLSDGTIVSLTDMLTTAEHNLSIVKFEAISEAMAAWKIICFVDPMLSMDAFSEQNGTVDGYDDYLMHYYEEGETITDWWMVTLADMKPVQIPYPGDAITDFYQGQCLGLIVNGDVETEILYAPETGETTELFSIQNGGCLARYQGEAENLLYEGDKLLFMETLEDGKAQVSSYSLADGSITPLFKDNSSISFRIIGETKDRLIGTVGTSTDHVWIWKDDYWKGHWNYPSKILSGA